MTSYNVHGCSIGYRKYVKGFESYTNDNYTNLNKINIVSHWFYDCHLP